MNIKIIKGILFFGFGLLTIYVGVVKEDEFIKSLGIVASTIFGMEMIK